ncbi:TetR/AcrR family transcriptional regulator C-terminal domain-containing protein [Streptomyces sp. NPDC097619]|uniref:TetR/AcrR family transcriptional regulator n=1 Tax=Streptomyces sp. NPDC097619 TaxID=3157228 RepID=UPI00332143ED
MAAKSRPVPSVWARPKPSPRQVSLSREVILREAIAMLDADGTEALTMRGLGARLNAGATSAYRHVANKDELMELAVDEVLGEVFVPEGGGADWRAAVSECAQSFRATAIRHPWLCAELGRAGLAYQGPNLSGVVEGLAGLFDGLAPEDVPTAIDAVFSYAIGMSATESAWLTTVARSGLTEGEFLAEVLPTTPENAEEHRLLVADPVGIRDRKFVNGLDIFLDGLAARMPR